MATSIIVNPTELETVSGQIEAKNNTLKEKLDEFSKKFEEISQTWESTASTRTKEAIDSLKPHFQEYFEVVSDYAVQMKAIAEEYSTKETVNTSNAENVEFFM